MNIKKMKKDELIQEIERLNKVIEDADYNYRQEIAHYKEVAEYEKSKRYAEEIERRRYQSRYDDAQTQLTMEYNSYKKNEEELNKKIEELKNENLELLAIKYKYELQKERFENGQSVQKIKNERGAGRKKKFDDEVISEIIQARKENKSIRAIAKEFNCSIGLVQKIINEHK